MAEQTDFESQIARLLVAQLELDDVDPDQIGPDKPLFGHEADSLGLDSIDALEIALAVNQNYGIELRADDDANQRVFATLRSLAAHVDQERATS